MIKKLIKIRPTWQSKWQIDKSFYFKRAKAGWTPQYQQAFKTLQPKIKPFELAIAEKIDQTSSKEGDITEETFSTKEETSNEVSLFDRVKTNTNATVSVTTNKIISTGKELKEAFSDKTSIFTKRLMNLSKKVIGKDAKKEEEEKEEKEEGEKEGEEAKAKAKEEEEKQAAPVIETFYVPGKIIHIYPSETRYFAYYIPTNHQLLTQILVYKNLIEDHKVESYFLNLQQYLSQQHLIKLDFLKLSKQFDTLNTFELKKKQLQLLHHRFPSFINYSLREFCTCCFSDFTWNSTSHSFSQSAYDRKHCMACGDIICPSCSTNKISLPYYGIVNARCCDKCFYSYKPIQDMIKI